MEPWECVENVEQIMKEMPEAGTIYSTHDKTQYHIRWSRLEHEWLMTIGFTKRNAAHGHLSVLNPAERILVDRLVGDHLFGFTEFDRSPFRNLTRLGDSGTLPTTVVKGARESFATQWLDHANSLFHRATDDEIRVEIRALGSSEQGITTRLRGQVSGGLPSLGRRR